MAKTTVALLRELYKKACLYHEKTTIGVTIKEEVSGSVVYHGPVSTRYKSYKDMYDSLDLAKDILDDYVESHDKLNDAGLSDKELDVLLAPYIHNEYELIFIAKGDLTEEYANGITDKYEQKFRDIGATRINSEFWGNKKLAYPVREYGHGWYYLFNACMSSLTLTKFEEFINADEDVIKHICILKTRAEERDLSPADADKEIRDAAEAYLYEQDPKHAMAPKQRKEPVDLFNLICGIG